MPLKGGIAIFVHMAQQFGRDAVYDGMQGGNNYFLGLLAGIIAAAIGAFAWMEITIATHSHLGLVALGVGALVGFAIRMAGNGRSIIFGFMGAILTLLSCLCGEVMTAIQLASTVQLDFFETLKSVDLVALTERILSNTDPISYLIYGIGIFEGFKFSIKK